MMITENLVSWSKYITKLHEDHKTMCANPLLINNYRINLKHIEYHLCMYFLIIIKL